MDIYTYTYKQTKKLVIAVIGFTLLIIGIVMIVAPGPAIIVIPLALAVLATEFLWARRLLKKVKAKVKEHTELFRKKVPPQEESGNPPGTTELGATKSIDAPSSPMEPETEQTRKVF